MIQNCKKANLMRSPPKRDISKIKMASYLNIGFVNVFGQTGLKPDKVKRISDLTKEYNLDIVHLQETQVEFDSFEGDDFINNNFNIISNNSQSKYGSCSLVSSTFNYDNIRYDDAG